VSVVAENPRAVIGGNAPPEPTPFEIAEQKVGDIYDEAKLWLDGAKVDSQELADGIGNLISLAQDAWNAAEEARKAEKKPFDDGAKEVQARYKPLLEKAEQAKAACKKALQPWLQRLADEIEAKAKAAREEADRKRREAEDAIRATNAANLAERAAAEALVKDAKRAEKMATRAENQTATAGGDFGRATGLRTVYTATLVDPILAARHYWQARRSEMLASLQTMADQDVRQGKHEPDAIPGFTITKSTVPV
jgi:hypothetical protein